MTKLTKTLLAISLTGFVTGFTGLLWGIGTPIGAIFFGLGLISRILEKEVALYDHEQALQLASAQRAMLPAASQARRDVVNPVAAKSLSAVTSH
jgi:hypothetical protein